MYKAIKAIVRALIPNKLFFVLEPKFRAIHYKLFYQGKSFQCTVCGQRLKAFIPYLNYDKICPNCGSLSRDRRLWDVIKGIYLKPDQKILDFSPSRSIYRKFKAVGGKGYTTTDLSGNFLADHNFDITNIEVADETFDLILCYHILEHIPDDMKAMKELYRILKPEGEILVQTPFKEGNIYEDDTIVTAEDRLKHFGQEDHVRIYSVEGLEKRLTSAGFNVDVLSFEVAEDNKHGFTQNETILICTK